ncbi:hypothetical protein B0H19DRAFT_1381498 [Mycena capillaripes]|nr:hypothetical protein B0H19DRAFT_1381498 [Mycena capillaripes]
MSNPANSQTTQSVRGDIPGSGNPNDAEFTQISPEARGTGAAQQVPSNQVPSSMDRNSGAAFDLGTGTDSEYVPRNTNTTDEPGAPSERGGKPKIGDKVKGGAEKLAGSVTRNPGLKERGEEHKEGGYSVSGGDYNAHND